VFGTLLLATCSLLLNYTSFLESCIRAFLLDCADRFSGDDEVHTLFKFRNVDFLLLEICVFSYFAGRGKDSRTSAVCVFATHLGSLFSYCADACHK